MHTLYLCYTWMVVEDNNNRAKAGGRASPVPSARSSQPHSTQPSVPQ
jgi:hypothetical protein